MTDETIQSLKSNLNEFSKNYSEESKVGLAKNFSAAYSEKKFLGQEEKTIADQILSKLATDIFTSVRQSIANNLKNSEILPHNIAVMLANDVEEVAMPVLEFSSVLTDKDLVDIIKSNKSEAIQGSIVKRDSISEKVSNALIEVTDSDKIIRKLIEHQNADISKNGYDLIIDKFHNSEEVALAINNSKKVPQEVVNKLIAASSDIIKEKLRTLYPENFNKYQSTITMSVSRSWELNTLANIKENTTTQEIFNFVLQLKNQEKITPSLVLMSLCLGKIQFFQMSLAALAKSNFQKIQEECRSKEGLSQIYEASHLPSSLKSATMELYQIVSGLNTNGDMQKYTKELLEKIELNVKNQETPGMDYILNMIKRNILYNSDK